MKYHKKTILRMLEKNGDAMSAKQIRSALGLKKTATLKLKSELQKLVKNKKIVKQGSRFFIDSVLQKNTFLKGGKTQNFKKNNVNKNHSITNKKKYSGKFEKGYFTRNRKRFGFVDIGVDRPDIFIGKNEQGYAMEGDMVKIMILPTRGFRGKRRGKIVRILERASKKIVARVKKTKKGITASPILENSGLPPLRINNKLRELESGTLIEIELEENKKETNENLEVPIIKNLKVLDKISDSELGMQLVVDENLIRTEFPEDIKEYLKKISKKVHFDPSSGRKDLRDLHFLTIDGKTARDFDDAVCVIENKEPSLSFQLFVSIADVSHYIKPGDPIDKEAYLRATSVYLPWYAIHMLPEELSKNLCSLRPKVNRLTLTCEMQIDSEGVIKEYSIYESIIRSRARLNYEDVAELLDGKTSSIHSPVIRSNLRKMHKLAKILEKKRSQRGAIQFNFPEEVFEIDKNHRITSIENKYQSNAMKLIEQFMLEANETVAKHLVKNKIPSIYRVHDSPDLRKLKKLQKTFNRFGLSTALSKLKESKQFNEILKKIKDLPNFEQLQVLLLRSISLAVYETQNKGHFGLAAKYYTHFTSPIRRYPDLLVHRSLKNNIYLNLRSKKNKKIKSLINNETAEHCSIQERRAEKAERQSTDLIKVDYLTKYIGQIFQTTITQIEKNGFKIKLESIGLELFLPMDSIKNDYFIFDETSLSIKSQSKNKFIKFGQRLELILLHADSINRNLEFKIKKWLS